MELISLRKYPLDFKMALLEELGYESDGIYVLDKGGNVVMDRYTEEPVLVDNMVIFPGSTIILDNNPLSIASYIEEFGDIFEE